MFMALKREKVAYKNDDFEQKTMVVSPAIILACLLEWQTCICGARIYVVCKDMGIRVMM